MTLSSKGCEGIAEASKKRGDQIYTEPGQRDQRLLRSAEPAFNYKEHCLFCGKPDTYNHQRAVKGHKLNKLKRKSFKVRLKGYVIQEWIDGHIQ